jgi:hypothetical protein
LSTTTSAAPAARPSLVAGVAVVERAECGIDANVVTVQPRTIPHHATGTTSARTVITACTVTGTSVTGTRGTNTRGTVIALDVVGRSTEHEPPSTAAFGVADSLQRSRT